MHRFNRPLTGQGICQYKNRIGICFEHRGFQSGQVTKTVRKTFIHYNQCIFIPPGIFPGFGLQIGTCTDHHFIIAGTLICFKLRSTGNDDDTFLIDSCSVESSSGADEFGSDHGELLPETVIHRLQTGGFKFSRDKISSFINFRRKNFSAPHFIRSQELNNAICFFHLKNVFSFLCP